MAINKALALLLVVAVVAAPAAHALTAPLNSATNVRCCGTGDTGGCVDTDNQCNPIGVNSCCKVKTTLAKGTRITAVCYVPGQSINGDRRWLVISSPTKGYISDYYVSCGGLCNVPACN